MPGSGMSSWHRHFSFLTVIGAGVYLGTVTVIGALRTNTGLTELRLTPAPVALRAR